MRKEESGRSLEVSRCVGLPTDYWFATNCSLWKLSRNVVSRIEA